MGRPRRHATDPAAGRTAITTSSGFWARALGAALLALAVMGVPGSAASGEKGLGAPGSSMENAAGAAIPTDSVDRAGLGFFGAAAGLPVARDTARISSREIVVAGSRHRYAVVLPAGYDPSRTWPSVVFLHGAWECGEDLDRPLSVGLAPAVRRDPTRWPCIVLVPQKPRVEEEWVEREDLVLATLADARAAFSVDSDRVALTGISQGGHGAWLIAARHPAVWSCVVPIAAYGRALTVAPRVATLPVWAFHGLRDDVVDPRDTQRIVEAIRRERGARDLDPGGLDGARMTLYPDLNHGSWDAAYAEPALAQWMLSRVRSR